MDTILHHVGLLIKHLTLLILLLGTSDLIRPVFMVGYGGSVGGVCVEQHKKNNERQIVNYFQVNVACFVCRRVVNELCLSQSVKLWSKSNQSSSTVSLVFIITHGP